MTYREFVASTLPPAPETSGLRRLRIAAATSCLVSAALVFACLLLGNDPLWFAAIAHLLAVLGLGVLAVFIVRKARHDVGYWTPERVALHRFVTSAEHADRPMGVS